MIRPSVMLELPLIDELSLNIRVRLGSMKIQEQKQLV